jgi:hypothetical protein
MPYLFPSVAAPSKDDVHKLLKGTYPHLWWCSHEPFEQFKRAQVSDSDMRDYDAGEIAQWLWPKIIRRARFACGSEPQPATSKSTRTG